MRKNCARKILHAVLDLLPLIILPIFACAVRSDNNYEPINTTVSGYEVREKYQTNEVNSVNDLVAGNIYHCDNLYCTDESHITQFNIKILSIESIVFTEYTPDEYLVEDYNSNTDNFLNIIWYPSDFFGFASFTNEYCYMSLELDDVFTLINFDFTFDEEYTNDNKQFFTDMLSAYSDVTTMPTSSDFNVLEYVYNEEIVLDKTDVGSQMLYSLYIPIHDHFNMLNVFTFGDIYNWIQLNIFGGTAPLSIFIVYNIIVYEFIMDLIFLMYSVFMFIIDFAQGLLEHFLSWSKNGGSRKL